LEDTVEAHMDIGYSRIELAQKRKKERKKERKKKTHLDIIVCVKVIK
jgi:hypothetical protein